MADTTLGLIMEIGADPSNANAAMEAFASQSGQSLGMVQAQVREYQQAESSAYDEAVRRARGAGEETDRALLSNRESVRLLSEEMGVHLPRAVSGAVAEMLPGINAIGPALLGAFALAELPKFIEGVKNAATALGGYTEEVRKAEKADIDASTAALIHFKTIAEGTKLIAETNRALASMAAKQGDWKGEIEAANAAISDTKSVMASLLGPIGSAITLWRSYKAAVQEESDTRGKTAKLQQRLDVQLGHMTELQVKAHKDAAREHKKDLTEEREAERVYHKELKEEIAEEIRLREEAHKFGQGQTPEQRQAYAAQQEMVRQAAEAQRRVDRMLIEDARQLDQALKEIHKEHLQFPLDVDKQAAAITSALPKFSAWTAEIRQAKEITKEFTSATAQSAIATMFQGIAAGESFKRVAHEAVASIAKQAGIQAVWEAAQGFAMLALSFFMPNPAYVASADAHFTAAAIYGGIGGAAAGIAAGMRSPRGAGAGGGGAETGYGPTGGSGRGDGGSLTPQTLAPGVSSQAGRFGSPGSGVVIIRGTQAFEDFTAAAVNAAHARGVTINATFASRGAPVGH